MTIRKLTTIFGKIIAGLILLALLLFSLLFAYVSLALPSVETLKRVKLQSPLAIYSHDGQLIAEFGDIRRVPVPYKNIPPDLINAVLATEDQHFYQHPGVDFLGLMRASLVLITTGHKSQGGSTITMQVARNFFLSSKKTFGRKFNEILLALKIDHDLGKEAILELYFNKVFLGEHAYGFGAAAQVYYGKSLDQLTLAEYAMLAGLPQAPSVANPIINPKKAKERRHHVLSRMLEGGYINQEQFEEADKAPLTEKYHGQSSSLNAPYVAETIRSQLYAKYGEAIYSEGLNVYTTINSDLQRSANRALRQGLIAYEQRHHYIPEETNLETYTPKVEGAIIAMDPSTGGILAMTGGVDFNKSHFNRATQAYRQIGSTIKPFVYAAAISKGMTLASLENDAPIVIDDGSGQIWRPENDDHKFHGSVRMRESLVDSLNLASIRILQKTGLPYTLEFLSKFGFDAQKLPKGLSLALGTPDITPLQLNSSFLRFANGGYEVEAHLISKITNNYNEILYEPKKIKLCLSDEDVLDQKIEQYECAKQAVNPQIIYLLNSAMQDVIGRGTGKQARILNRQDLAGKTGTSNDQKDAWFAGFNPHISTLVWVGYDSPKSLYEYGAQAALPIWINFMRDALHNEEESFLPRPEGIISIRIDPETGLRVPATYQHSLFELFLAGTEPPMIDSQVDQNNNLSATEKKQKDDLDLYE